MANGRKYKEPGKVHPRFVSDNSKMIYNQFNENEEPWNKLLIDLDAIQSNYRSIKALLPKNCLFYAVIKSDAYGHGIIPVSKKLIESGCNHVAVGSLWEAIQVRKQGFEGEILLLNPILKWMAELAVYYDLSVSVFNTNILDSLQEKAKKLNKKVRVHLNVDVGLRRFGVPPKKLFRIAEKAFSKSKIEVEGLYAQPRDPKSAIKSFEKISSIYHKMVSKGISPNVLHFANSITFLKYPRTADVGGVRIGILLYGVLPPEQPDNSNVKIPLKPSMSLETNVVQLREVPRGSKIGYRAKNKLDHDASIATIPIGYFHGLNRRLSKKGYVLVNRFESPFIGRISMNSSTIDVSDIPGVSIGDKVTIIGSQGKSKIQINDVAKNSGTISAEIMVSLGRGIKRKYNDQNKILA